jgi:site-specific recombinase XerD
MDQIVDAGTEIIEHGQLSREEFLRRFDRWMRLDVAAGNASPATLRSYASDVAQHLGWLNDQNLHPTTVSDDDLKLYRADLVDRYALSTVARKLVAIRRFYEMAHARGVLPRNPAARLRSPVDHTSRAENVKYLPYDKLRAVFALPVDLHGDMPRGCRDRAILVAMGIHGLRTIEVHRLDVEDYEDGPAQYGTLHLFGKGDRRRTVYLTKETQPILEDWLAARQELGATDPAIFLTLHCGVRRDRDPHHRISRRSIRSLVDNYLQKAGAKRPGISCHALRHSFATHALANGARLIDISQVLGHSSVTTTQVYAQVVDREKHNPSKTLGDLL